MAITPAMAIGRRQLLIRGIVQGVGFRPFVYRTARALELSGYIFNSSSGVIVEIEGTPGAMDEFLKKLRDSPPPLAQISNIDIAEMAPSGEMEFEIRASRSQEDVFAPVPADAGTCADCWSEFGEPSNRRYGYAFTNCTNCGPRYSIIQDAPYDRAVTTMAAFAMCNRCRAEYNDPGNRRFHAEPNACAACGPSLLLRQRGEALFGREEFSAAAGDGLATIRKTRQLLDDGKIIAVKGLGGFLLACDANNDAAVQLLRERKRRSDKPFAVMIRDLATVEAFCEVNDAERIALQSSRRPIVILKQRAGWPLAPAISPGNATVGVMLPYTPLHYLLFSDSPAEPAEFAALVMTSGNLSEEPIVIDNDDALTRLRSIADWFLFHNRDIYMRVDDSVVRCYRGTERVLRRSRGYVPQLIDLGQPMQPLLACGAELKNTFCLTRENQAILSQHIGDLENYETLSFFEETLENLKRLFRVEPQAVAYDLHPNYMSTRYALGLPVQQKIGVQHHHAHIASCMAENHLRGKVIGVAMDGTGYGTDNKIWGGEFLVADFAGFERHAHLRYVPLPGGDAAVRQPWRMGLSYLRDTFGDELSLDMEFLSHIPEKQVAIVDAMISRRIHSIDTSSCGRLFDAVAALVGLGDRVSFEGQAAIALEAVAQQGAEEYYPFELDDGEIVQWDMRPAIESIVKDVRNGQPASDISARLHNTVAAAIVAVCERIRMREKLQRVCLSGGVFQNLYLLEGTVKGLYGSGFEVFLHAQVPPNDGGISLGQAVIANESLRRGD